MLVDLFFIFSQTVKISNKKSKTAPTTNVIFIYFVVNSMKPVIVFSLTIKINKYFTFTYIVEPRINLCKRVHFKQFSDKPNLFNGKLTLTMDFFNWPR